MPHRGVYSLDGFDDQCGAATCAPITGTAAANPGGTIELGFNIVSSPDAAPSHVAVALSMTTLGGTWTDSAGHTGPFVFTQGPGTGGDPRPTSGTIGAVAVDSTQVQLRVSGTCPAGQVVQRIKQDGTVDCLAAGTGNITAVVAPASLGMQGGGTNGAVFVGLRLTASGAFDFNNRDGFESRLVLYADRVAMTAWHPSKSAFRAGSVANNGSQWKLANVGEATIAGGYGTNAQGFASVAFGHSSLAGARESAAVGSGVLTFGEGSIALGSNASTTFAARGSFVYGDRSTTTLLQSFVPNQFLVRAGGGTRFFSGADLSTGVSLAANASAWSSVSDASMKEHFRDLDGTDVLAKLAAMPIREWSYKAQDASIRHVGPTAQDFHAAFGLGEDPLRISTIDVDGVALRAIQALEARTREATGALARENAELRAEIAALRQVLERR